MTHSDYVLNRAINRYVCGLMSYQDAVAHIRQIPDVRDRRVALARIASERDDVESERAAQALL